MNKKRSKICFLLPTHWGYSFGGSEYQVKYIIENLLKQNKFEIYYVCKNAKEGEKTSKYRLIKLKSHNPLQRHFFFCDYFQLNKILGKINPKIIYLRVGTPYIGFATRFCEKFNCKTIWHIASENDITRRKYRLKKSLFFQILDSKIFEYGIKKVDFIIGQISSQDQLLQKNYRRKCDTILPNIHPLPECKIEKRGPIKVVWITNIKSLKQPDIFLKLAKKFESYSEIEFIMIGREPSNPKFNALMREIKQQKNLYYLEELPIIEVNKFLCNSHILVNTSIYEGFPNTFIQAWMREVPVVSLNVDPDDVIKKNNIGFHSKTFEQMVKDVRFLIKHSEIRKEMGKRAREYAVREHDINKIIPKYIDVFENLLTHK